MGQFTDPGLPEDALADLGFPYLGPRLGLFYLLPSGPFHAGRAWRWTSQLTGESRLLKARPECTRSREHSLLAWQLATDPLWQTCSWLPTLIHAEKPWLVFRGMIYQAWTWINGTIPDPLNFRLNLGLERLARFSEIARWALGERQGPVPCVNSREQALQLWLETGAAFSGCLEERCVRVLAERVAAAKVALGKMPRTGKLLPCHGDPWAGNWLQTNSDSESLEYGLIDWSTVRWDHPASDRARLIGSTGKPDSDRRMTDCDMDHLLAWTGHVAALCNWMVKRKDGPWGPEARNRVEWLLCRLGE